MRRVLAIDPGITTGIAIYDENGELDATLTARKEKIYKNGFLTSLYAMSKPEVVLVESLPTRNVHADTLILATFIMNWFEISGLKPIVIQPSQWKGLVERVEIPGQHARDAATMCKWWIEKEKNSGR